MKVATAEDFSDLEDMCMHFLEASPYKDLGDKEAIRVFLGQILEGANTEKVIILEPGKGFIVGMAMPFIFGTHMLATEIAWWVEPDQRGSGLGTELRDALEYWAINIAGCKMISMSALDVKLDDYYKEKGYTLYERAYMKVF